MMKKIALDIDGTITAHPEFFSKLAKETLTAGGEVHIVTSRCDAESWVRSETERQLRDLGMVWDALHFIPDIPVAKENCPHQELDWYNKHMWQKVDYCQKHGIEVFYDDDAKVAALFAKYAPEIEFHLVTDERETRDDGRGTKDEKC